jgi:hypothetical protein
MRQIAAKGSPNTRPEILLTFLSIAFLFAVTSPIGRSIAETAAGAGEKSSDVLALAAELGSDNEKARESAAEGIVKVRGELVDRLMELAKQPGKVLVSPNGERRAYLWHEPKHLAILLLGDLRASEAAPLLLENIEYRNPREFFGSMMTNTEWYPAVEALSKIGMPSVDPTVIKLSHVDPKSKAAELCCWTLTEILGPRLARMRVQIAIEETPDASAREKLKAALPYEFFKTREEKATEERAKQGGPGTTK